MSHHISSVKCRNRIKVFSANCWYSLYPMLKGALLSCNSGWQVREATVRLR